MSIKILVGDNQQTLKTLPDQSVNCVVTSPPYFGLRDYGHDGQIGLEPTPEAYVAELVGVFREVWRVLRDDGTGWLNLGDSYASSGAIDKRPDNRTNSDAGFIPRSKKRTAPTPANLKSKDLIGIPWRVAFALQADGWYLRQDIIWHKPNPMPESVTDRCTKAHEYIFLLSKSARYYYDNEAVKEEASDHPATANRRLYSDDSAVGTKALHGNGWGQSGKGINGAYRTSTRNRRSVWTVATQPYSGAHFATFPPALIEPCILAGCPKGGTVLDPFGGAGTTGMVADRLGRDAILCEINPEYAELARRRIVEDAGMFAEVEVIANE